jgi:GTP diphosphokinase / guanosine-3',5'-bis(diphosphate) 3'-diphosphatase
MDSNIIDLNLKELYKCLLKNHSDIFTYHERKEIRSILGNFYPIMTSNNPNVGPDVSHKMQSVRILLDEIGLGKAAILGILLHDLVERKVIAVVDIDSKFKVRIEPLIRGLIRVSELYSKGASLDTENFRKLFITMAEDVRVILIIIAEHLQIMRTLYLLPEDERQLAARESSFLYAPLAHRLGLYKIKTELEDLSLKYTNREIYNDIASKLNETKSSRDKYIKDFIEPLKENLNRLGYKFEIKGRTKSIHSIYHKMKKQNTTVDKIYDLFAIRIIFDIPFELEKSVCWQAYSIIADMYQPNPNRLRDWLSIPKSNGYESLHTTVLGREGKWVEIQIRTIRMDEIAEKGLAAHWKYKGVQSDSNMDEWLKTIREVLENPDMNGVELLDEFKLNLYDKEVFVFTPKGDLHKLPKGSTTLDFAFAIHSNLGMKCTGAKVNGKNVPIKYELKNGDSIEILTSPTQKPNISWLKNVVTSKAKNKIRQALKEIEYKDAELGREMLLRRFKNWKIELEDGQISKLAKKKGFKKVSDFYQEIANENIELYEIKEAYQNLEKSSFNSDLTENRKADSFIKDLNQFDSKAKEDVLIIGQNLKNVEYKLSKCCNPIYGDDVFGFVSVVGGIKIHRRDCPNAPQMISKFGYRIIKAEWHGKYTGVQYSVTLRIVGNDDIGIITNISSLVSKEKDISIRTISIDSNDGLFQGQLTLMVNDNKRAESIVKKISQVKGVKNVSRT